MRTNNKQNVIGIFDSGVGGLSVWKEINQLLPDAPTLYLADHRHMPYGWRPFEEIRAFAEGITRFLLAEGATMIVMACNTISAAALYPMRGLYPDIPFVGMEPALKPAIERTRSGAVGVIATEATLKGELFTNLIERYAANARVMAQPCPGLAEAVEAGALNTPQTKALLQQYLLPMKEAGIDQLAIGCTHYPFLQPAIEQILGPDVAIIDPAAAVAAQTARILAQRNGKVTSSLLLKQQKQHIFYTSGNAETFAKVIPTLLPQFEEKLPQVQAIRWQVGHLVKSGQTAGKG